jgi:anti-sigma regulatory factor (Ser/Thr protein kinase)
VSFPSSEILRLCLRRDASAPRLARRALEQVDMIQPLHDDALLVASELTTNVVAEAGAEPDGEIELVAELVHDGLRIAVTDRFNSAEIIPSLRLASEVRPQGLGLRIIQAVSRRWGAERFEGRRMWAVVPI